MDTFFDRLGEVVRSFLEDEDDRLFGGRGRKASSDPDLDAAYEELDEFLSGGRKGRSADWKDKEEHGSGAWGERRSEGFRPGSAEGSAGRTSGGASGAGTYRSGSAAGSSASGTGPRPSAVPESLRQDFGELGLSVGASEAECKAAYKRLLKIHHPDRHAGHPGNLKKATEKSSRINAAYQRIARWRETGKVD